MSALPLARVQARLAELREWALEGDAIVKEFSFPNFKAGVEFVNGVAGIAERMNHHPSILIEYDKVRLAITTHDENGLTDKDFMLAEEIERLLK